MMTTKVDKLVSIGWNRGRSNVTVLREHYLRDDISCHYQDCPICDNSSATSLLLPSANHYVIPDGETLCLFQELFEHPNLTGIILTQTAANTVRDEVGRRSHQNLVKNMTDPKKFSSIFDNEHQIECFTPRQPKETVKEWRTRLHLFGIVWYINHLEMAGATHISIVLVTENLREYEWRLKSGCHGNVHIMSLPSYISSVWCSGIGSSLQAMYESLEATRETKLLEKETDGFSEHVPLDQVAKGILEGKYVAGSLRVSQYHPRTEAYVTTSEIITSSQLDILEGVSALDILIPGISLRNRAIQGDSVAVEILPCNQWRGRSQALPTGNDASSSSHEHQSLRVLPTGRVVAVISRDNKEIVATFPEEGASSGSGKNKRVLVIPYDHRFPKIRIATSLSSQLRNHRIVVKIDKWDINSQYPEGHFVRSIGLIGDIETETESILIEAQLNWGSFGPIILSELPDGSHWSVDPEEVAKRSDLRETHLIFSIDPKGCEDVDDALSIRTLKNGDIELGVHIADVSYFVTPGSHTDREAKQRSTSIYLADRRYDMLPHVLSVNLCSLHSNVDRYAVSVIWRLSGTTHEVLKVWYGRTVIKSAYELAYEVAQDLYDGKDPSMIIPHIKELHESNLTSSSIKEKLKKLTSAVKELVTVARVLKSRRNAEGALELEGVEVKVQLGEEKSIEKLLPKQPLEMHDVIAEFMIFANHWVAKKLYESFPSKALLRCHPTPREERFLPLQITAAAKGHTIVPDSNFTVANSLNTAQDPSDPMYNKVLRMLATHAMPQANYFSTGSQKEEEFHHYGLALDHYTHFTSPIRRYADLIVHRQLLEALNKDSNSTNIADIGGKELSELCTHMNKKKRSASLAQIASTGLFQALYFLQDQETRCVSEGVIYTIKANGVLAFLPRFGIQGPVYLKRKNGLVIVPEANNEGFQESDGSIVFTDHYITVSYPSGQYTLRLFDHIKVKVNVMHGRTHPHSFSLELLSCVPLKTGNEGTSSLTKVPSSTKHELIKVVKSEAAQRSVRDVADQHSEYSTRSDSLYCVIQKMRKMGMNDTKDRIAGKLQ